MEEHTIFSATLGLSSSWQIVAVALVDKEKRMDITVEFAHGCRACCPVCGCESQPVDLCRETWKHHNFFHFKTFLHARVPLIQCPQGCGVNKIEVPWSKPGRNFVPM